MLFQIAKKTETPAHIVVISEQNGSAGHHVAPMRPQIEWVDYDSIAG